MMKERKITCIAEQMPDDWQLIRAALDVVYAHRPGACMISLYDQTIPHLMRMARNRLDNIKKEYDRMKADKENRESRAGKGKVKP